MISVRSIWNDFTQLFYPHTCAGCGTDALNAAVPVCLQCLEQLTTTNFHLHAHNPVEKCFWGRIPILAATAYCYLSTDSVIRNVLHQLKYKGNRQAGLFMGAMMGKSLMESNRFTDIDLLVPMPLHPGREKKRGYNQAGLLCLGMASVMQLPVSKNAVKRLSATNTQTHMNRIERWQNMQGRFHLQNPTDLANKHVLLVDDVVTTGATLEACGQALLAASNLRLSIATLAYRAL